MFYRLIGAAENFRNYMMVNYTQEYANLFDGRSHKDIYKPIEFKMTKETEIEFPIADIQTGYLPICSERAKKLIEEICDKNEVEFLPCKLEGTDKQYYIFNILGSEDCVDYEKSKYKSFPSNPNKIMFFEHIEFNKTINRHFFRIKDLPYCYYFISKETKEKLEKSGLTGLDITDKLF